MNSCLEHQTNAHNILRPLERNSQRGSVGEKGSRAGPRVDLPLHGYLLLQHKRAPRRATSGKKARWRMSQRHLLRGEDPCLSSMTTLSSMNTIYAAGSLLSNGPPPKVPLLCLALSPHSQGTFSSSGFCLIFLSAKPREMLPDHCKSIRALNIYYKMAGGLRGSARGEGACWGGNVTRDHSCTRGSVLED